MAQFPTAAILIIGNEVLSGRTREANGWLAAQRLFARGCKLAEMAVVPDQAESIASTLNRLRHTYAAVITSGGIGPTHDDITMASVAAAFDVPLLEIEEVVRLMAERFGTDGVNEGRRRMASLPAGAQPIRCERSIAPGAHIGNVFVLAGVPSIFESQLESIIHLFGDTPFQRREIPFFGPESLLAVELGEIASAHASVEIGSYPARCGDLPCGKIAISGKDLAVLIQVEEKVRRMVADLGMASQTE